MGTKQVTLTARQECIFLILKDTMSFKSSSKVKYAVFHWGEAVHLSHTYINIQNSNPGEKSVKIKILFDEQAGHLSLSAVDFLPVSLGGHDCHVFSTESMLYLTTEAYVWF